MTSINKEKGIFKGKVFLKKIFERERERERGSMSGERGEGQRKRKRIPSRVPIGHEAHSGLNLISLRL